ncbi:MAG: TonB-dependent receptor [Lacunisphaera sp.]|nr:TonB-dependent receptor [Lacunisphaera sp.]
MTPQSLIPALINGKRFTVLRMGLALFATFALALGSHAQSPAEPLGAVQGTVSNAVSGAPLGRAKITIRGTAQEALTDDDGRFYLRRAPAKDIELEVSYLGFVSQTLRVTVPQGGLAAQDFQLSRERTDRRDQEGPTLVLDTFQVVAEQTMSGQAVAMNEQRHAANIKNVVSFDELGDRGQENIGDYVRFLPGVTILDDGENPGRISLGGFPAEMSNIQIDGMDVAATGIGPTSSRAAALQDVPILNIDRVEVSKVPTPDQPASGLGGSMNLIAKTGAGLKHPVGRYQVYMNFNNVDGLNLNGGSRQPHDRASPGHKEPSFSLSYAFPVGKSLSVNLGVSRSWRQRPTDDTPSEVAFWNLRNTYITTGAPKDYALAITQWRQEASISRTENLQLGVDWKISQNDTLSLQVQQRAVLDKKAMSFFTSRVNLNYDAIGNADYTESRGTTGRFEMGTLNPSNYDATTDTSMLSLRYQHRGPLWIIDGSASYSAADRERSSLGKGYFNGVLANALNVNIRGDGIGKSSSIGPETYTITRTNGTVLDPYNADNYTLSTANEEYALYQTDLTAGRLNVSRAIGRNLTLKIGGAYNRLDKDDTRPVKNYTFVGQAAGQTAVSLYDIVDESIDVKMNGNPVRWISPVKVYDLFVEHPEYFTLNTTHIQNRAQNSKRMLEDITAGYFRFDLRLLSNRLNFTGGVRYEKTDLKGWSMKRDNFAIYQRDAAGNLLRTSAGALIPITNNAEERLRLINQERAQFESQSYDGFYPSLNANYAFNENLVVRAAYAKTIGRPDVQYVVAGITVPVPTDSNPTTARTIVVGNPGLEPWTADSFHLSLDSYHLKGGFGSVGVYHKKVSNFFAQRGQPTTAATLEAYGIPEGDIDYMLADNYVLRRWENVGDATLNGAELSYRQDLLFLPSWLQLTQVWVNYTHLKVGGANAEDFVGFSPDSLTAGLNYIRPRFSVRLTCAYQAETKRAEVVVVPGTSVEGFIPQSTYEYQAAYTRYGISAEYALSKKLALYLNWDDVFAKDRLVYRRAPDTPAFAQIYQRYVTPSYIVIGVKGSF